MDNDAIHEAFEELRIMRVIVKECDNGATLLLDRTRLSKLGYTLVFGDNLTPVFVKLFDLQYVYDPIFYMSDRIPKAALDTYVISKIKIERISGYTRLISSSSPPPPHP